MTALAAEKNVRPLGSAAVLEMQRLKQKGSTTIYQGALVVIDGGYAAPASSAPGLIAAGRAEKTSVNAGGDGAVFCEVRRGAFPFENSSAGDAIAQADLGNVCYIVDDQTVAKTDGGGARSKAGRIISVSEGDSKVYVEVGVDTSAGAAGYSVVSIPVDLTQLANSAVAARFTPGFAGRIVKTAFQTTVPATTAAKAATLQPSVAGTPTTGGALALTSANQTPLGNSVAGTAITAGNAFTAAQEITVVASSVTAFVEGSGVLLITLSGA